MKTLKPLIIVLAAGSLGLIVPPSFAQSPELDQLKTNMQTMQHNMEEMQKKIQELEREKPAANQPTATNASAVPAGFLNFGSWTNGSIGHESLTRWRHLLRDEQAGAPRPNDYTLDPEYHGFIPVPNTSAIIKFNAKPRVDITSDTRNSGNPDRFVTAQIPVKSAADYGGSEQFNINARGSTVSVDLRAPDMNGNLRFFYQNDFFGSGSGMSYRLKHLYGEFYNVTAGYTYSCFEDPDAWPDTVDYEGPNSVIFARRALGRYMVPLGEALQFNVGVEAPGSEIDGNSTTNSVAGVSRFPDSALNFRWENKKLGHIQLGGVVRDVGVHGEVNGSDHVLGWGFNLASSINVFGKDSFQTQLTYGHGIFRYFNDDFVNNDAAFDSEGNLKAIPAFGAMAAYTHRWSEDFRSTATFGYVHLDNTSPQGPDAYHETEYASINLIWQLRKHLSVGLEGLYGRKEVQSGATGDVWRTQLGLVYSLFD
jgi:hypothetical protein